LAESIKPVAYGNFTIIPLAELFPASRLFSYLLPEVRYSDYSRQFLR